MNNKKRVFSIKNINIIKSFIFFSGILLIFIVLIYKNNFYKEEEPSFRALEKIINNIQEVNIDGVDKIWLFENNQQDIISIDIIFKGLSSVEFNDYPGISNFLIKALVTTAGDYTPAEFSKILEEYSIKLSSYMTRDYISLTLTTLDRYKYRAFSLLKLILSQSQFSEEVISVVKEEMVREYNNHQSSKYSVYKIINQEVSKHNNSNIITGNITSINRINSQILQNFRDKVITKNNIYITISGRISAEEAKQDLKSVFSGLSNETFNYPVLFDDNNITNHITDISIIKKINDTPVNNIASTKVFFILPYLNDYLNLEEEINIVSYYINLYSKEFLQSQEQIVKNINSTLDINGVMPLWIISFDTDVEEEDIAIDIVKDSLHNLIDNKYNFRHILISRDNMLNDYLRYFSNNTDAARYINNFHFKNYTKESLLEKIDIYQNININRINIALERLDINNILTIKTTENITSDNK